MFSALPTYAELFEGYKIKLDMNFKLISREKFCFVPMFAESLYKNKTYLDKVPPNAFLCITYSLVASNIHSQAAVALTANAKRS